MGACRQCGVMPMFHQGDRCPMCGCEDAWELNMEETWMENLRKQDAEVSKSEVDFFKELKRRKEMTKEDLLKEWTNVAYHGTVLAKNESGVRGAINDALQAVYDVGFEAGKDAEKLEIQLSKHGKPYGYETD